MSVLFIGKWDLAGAYISDRLIREGNKVCWITDEQTKILWNKKFKGNIYRGSFNKEECHRVMKVNAVDTVIYMTGGLRENLEGLAEYSSRMLELTEVLSLLKSYSLKNMVYLSSVELDYQEVYSPVLTELAAGEMLCKAYHSAYGLPLLILRLGNVYGSFGLNQMGYTGQMMQKIQKNEVITSSYSESDYIDVIFGEDVAVAAEQLLKCEKQGEYRVITGHPISFAEYFRCLGEAAGKTPEVVWKREKTTAPEEFFKKEQKLKEETGWVPFYLLSEKGVPVLASSLRQKEEEYRKVEKRGVKWWLERIRKQRTIWSVTETIGLFAVTTFFIQITGSGLDTKYADLRMMFVAIVSCLHGMRMGILGIVLACLSYMAELHSAQIDVSYLMYSVDTWVPFAAYFITGTVIGYMVDRRQDDMDNLRESHRLLSDKYDFLKSIHGEVLEVKGSLRRQVITSKYSFGHAYEVAVELDSLKPELILLKVISILEHIMDCDKAAVFLFGKKNTPYVRLKACSSQLRDTVGNSLNMEQYPEMQKSFSEEGLFVNKGLLEGYPDYAAPLYFRGELYAFVAVYDLQTEKLTVYFQNLFKIISSLIEKNLVKALEYENAQHDELYFPRTELLHPKAFEERLHIMKEESDDIAYTFMECKVYPQCPMTQQEAAERIQSIIRGNDSMGVDKDGDYAVILVNMTEEFIDNVRVRFERKQLSLEVKVRE